MLAKSSSFLYNQISYPNKNFVLLEKLLLHTIRDRGYTKYFYVNSSLYFGSDGHTKRTVPHFPAMNIITICSPSLECRSCKVEYPVLVVLPVLVSSTDDQKIS